MYIYFLTSETRRINRPDSVGYNVLTFKPNWFYFVWIYWT